MKPKINEHKDDNLLFNNNFDLHESKKLAICHI